MPEVGHILRKAREDKGIDLKEVERALKIRRRFLIALENDQPIEDLNDIYVKGFLRSYAVYLELDPDHIVQSYGSGPPQTESGPQPHHIPLAPSFSAMASGKTEETSRSRIWRVVIPLAGILVGAAILLVGISMARKAGPPSPAEATAAWALTQEVEASQTMSDTVGIELTPQGSPTATFTPTRTPKPTSTPTVTPTPTPEFYTGVTIELIAKANAWTQIRVDGKKVFEGMLEPGMRRHWRGEDRVEVRCGNAGGVEAFVNGESIGLLGGEGQVVDMEWQKEKGPPPPPSPTPVIPIATSEGVTTEVITTTDVMTR